MQRRAISVARATLLVNAKGLYAANRRLVRRRRSRGRAVHSARYSERRGRLKLRGYVVGDKALLRSVVRPDEATGSAHNEGVDIVHQFGRVGAARLLAPYLRKLGTLVLSRAQQSTVHDAHKSARQSYAARDPRRSDSRERVERSAVRRRGFRIAVQSCKMAKAMNTSDDTATWVRPIAVKMSAIGAFQGKRPADITSRPTAMPAVATAGPSILLRASRSNHFSKVDPFGILVAPVHARIVEPIYRHRPYGVE